LHHNVQQRLLATNKCKLFVNDLNIRCQVAWNNFTFHQDGALHCRTDWNTQSHSGLPVDKCSDVTETPNWPPNSPVLNPVYYSVWGTLQQPVRSGPSETNPKQLLGHDEQRTDHRCYWPVV